MILQSFDDIVIGDFHCLVDMQISESRQLEYKRDLYGKNDSSRREFAADVSAMANAFGGDIILGIEEKNGTASRLVGIQSDNMDELARGIIEFIRSSILPEILGIRVRSFDLESNRAVVLIRVPRSYAAPHRVIVAKDSRFFIRDENGKHPMSISELRHAFLYGVELEERVKQFRRDRVDLLKRNEGPFGLRISEPYILIHMAPQSAFTEEGQTIVDLKSENVKPIESSGWDGIYCLDGYITYSGNRDQPQEPRSFTTTFRTGIVEAVCLLGHGKHEGKESIYLGNVDSAIVEGVRRFQAFCRRNSLSCPCYIMPTMLNAKGLTAYVDRFRFPIDNLYPVRLGDIFLPEIKIDQFMDDGDVWAELRPTFDVLANAFGLPRSLSYDNEGKYKER